MNAPFIPHLFKLVQRSFRSLLAPPIPPPPPAAPNPVAGGVTLSDPDAVCESTAEGSSCQGGLVGGAQNAGSAKRSGPGGAPVAAGKGGAASCGSAGRWVGEEMPPGAERGSKCADTRTQKRRASPPKADETRSINPRASSHVLRPHIWCAICVPPPPA